MPLLKPALEKKIMLDLPTDEDPEQTAYVTVRQATQREVERRDALNAEQSSILRKDSTEVEVKRRFSYQEQRRLEVFLTLSDCNIEIPDPAVSDPDRVKSLFTFKKSEGKMRIDMTEKEFDDAWGVLPENWATAIHDAVLEVNVQWDTRFRR